MPPASLTLASIQMDATIAPRSERLQRAGHWLRQAHEAGADLALLPEMFNCGYGYDRARVPAEPWDGPTLSFLSESAKSHGIACAGSFLVEDAGEVFNSLALATANGDVHRYDKVYPWGWERSLFRGSRSRTVVADTALGRIGMLVCWDSAHPELWAEYAGKVDLMLVSSCPPDVTNPIFSLRDGTRLTLEHSPLLRGFSGGAHEVFGPMIDEQAAWLGVPLCASVGCGSVTTLLPRSKTLAPAFLYLYGSKDFETVSMTCQLTPGSKVLDQGGHRVAERSQKEGEGMVIGRVDLAAERPTPKTEQPRARVPRSGFWISDLVLPKLMESEYRDRLRALS